MMNAFVDSRCKEASVRKKKLCYSSFPANLMRGDGASSFALMITPVPSSRCKGHIVIWSQWGENYLRHGPETGRVRLVGDATTHGSASDGSQPFTCRRPPYRYSHVAPSHIQSIIWHGKKMNRFGGTANSTRVDAHVTLQGSQMLRF